MTRASCTFRLLTENQKMDLHNQALKYLKKYARRCVSCGQGEFAKLLDQVAKKEQRKRKITNLHLSLDNMDFEEINVVEEFNDGKVESFYEIFSSILICYK